MQSTRVSLSPNSPLSTLKQDLPAGLVVFLVAVPLCLGIAQASGAPLLSGLVAGMVGGLVIGLLSRSPLSVSGPAAGLAVIVAATIQSLGFRGFLLAVVLAGVLQLVLGVLRLGVIAHYFPSAVIKGMLAAIGLLIIIKQLPHAVGFDREALADPTVGIRQPLASVRILLENTHAGAVGIALACLVAQLSWPRLQRGVLVWVPAPLVTVVLGGVGAKLLSSSGDAWALEPEHLVTLPRFDGLSSIAAAVVTPDFTRAMEPAIWTAAITLCIVASIETLLSIEAVDRLDPHKRISPPSRELVAQGIGNIVSALLGGLPVTSVIVRSSANVQAGGQTRASAIFHGLLILVGVLLFSPLLNQVPLAALAVVLILVGTKLSAPSLWRSMWRAGAGQFIPFAATVLAVVATDLLKGTLFGLAVGIFFAILRQQENALVVSAEGDEVTLRFQKDMTFLHKAQLKEALRQIPDGRRVRVDRSDLHAVDDDIEELLAEFASNASDRNLTVTENLPEGAIARRQRLGAGNH